MPSCTAPTKQNTKRATADPLTVRTVRERCRQSVFTPASTLKEEDHVAEAWRSQVGETLTGPVEIAVVYTPDATVLHVTTSPHNARTLRGDLDNYVKLTLDALNGVAWVDDGQVVRIHAVKVDRGEQETPAP